MDQESEYHRADNYKFSNSNNDMLLESGRLGHSRNFDRNGIQSLNSRPISNDDFRGRFNNQQNDEYISHPRQRGFNSNQQYIRDRNNSNQFRNQKARQGSFALVKSTGPDHEDLQQEKCTINSRAPSLAPELSMPVYQTLEKKDDAWDGKKRVEDAGGDERAARQEEWAWGTGSKWLGAPAEKPKLNLHAGPPRAEMFENAPKVQGGIGEKLLNRMGWRTGEGLGKTKGGTLEPIKFTEIKNDRRGLDSSARVNDHEKNLVARVGEEAAKRLKEQIERKKE